MDSASNYETYIRAQFASAKINTDPFPYLVIENVLPPDLYESMEADCPSELESTIASIVLQPIRVRWVKPRKLGGITIPVFPLNLIARTQPIFAIRPGEVTRPPLGRFARRWAKTYLPYIDLVDELTRKTFSAMAEAYQSQLIRLGFMRTKSPLNIGQGLFTHRLNDWTIGPHVHDIGQIVQSMIYFPLKGSSEEQGTVLYRLKNRRP